MVKCADFRISSYSGKHGPACAARASPRRSPPVSAISEAVGEACALQDPAGRESPDPALYGSMLRRTWGISVRTG